MNDDVTPPTGDPVKPDTFNDQNSPEPASKPIAPPAGSPIDMPAPTGAETPPPAGEPVVIPAPAGATEQQPVLEPKPSRPEDTTQVLPVSEPIIPETPVEDMQQAPAPATSYSTSAYNMAAAGAAQAVPTPTPSPVSSGVQPMPAPAPAPGPGTAPYPPTAPAKKKKSKKPLIITLIVVAAVIILAVVGVLVYQEVQRSNAYDAAMELYQNEEYRAAAGAFSELGDYRDSADMVGESNEQQRLKEEREALEAAKLQFEDAVALYDAGEFSSARSEFVALKDTKLEEDLDEWINKCDYASADALYTAGDVEGAYNAFLALGSYSDAADRAAAIPQAFPATSVIYQDPAYYYDGAAIDIDYRFSSGGSFYKIYSGDVLVASLFLNANTTQRVYLAPGNYTIKEGSGDIWFGPEVAFGKDGWYSIMTFDDTGTDYIALTDNALVTLTINSGSSGNVSEKGEDHSNF